MQRLGIVSRRSAAAVPLWVAVSGVIWLLYRSYKRRVHGIGSDRRPVSSAPRPLRQVPARGASVGQATKAEVWPGGLEAAAVWSAVYGLALTIGLLVRYLGGGALLALFLGASVPVCAVVLVYRATRASCVGSEDEEASGTPGAAVGVPGEGNLQQERWWREVDTSAVRGLETMAVITRLLGARVVRHLPIGDKRLEAPWLPGNLTGELVYRELGMKVDDPEKRYLAFWLNFPDASVLFFHEVTDPSKLRPTEDFLSQNLKLILNPVSRLPIPAKSPKDAATVGDYFNPRNASCAVSGQVCIIQINLCSVFILRQMLGKIKSGLGFALECFLVDWLGQSTLSACRLTVTEEFLQRMAKDEAAGL